jgi:hypothetical protein
VREGETAMVCHETHDWLVFVPVLIALAGAVLNSWWEARRKRKLRERWGQTWVKAYID